jgi:trigger factor
MRATSTNLDDNRIKLSVEVDEDEMNAAIDAAAASLSKQMTVKGFRKGKVPKSFDPKPFASHCRTFTPAPSPTP